MLEILDTAGTVSYLNTHSYHLRVRLIDVMASVLQMMGSSRHVSIPADRDE